MLKNKKCLTLVLLLSILFNFTIGYKYFHRFYWEYFVKKPFITYKYERDELFEKLDIKNTDIVFIGNSITQHFEVFELTGDSRVRNRGIGGDTTEGVCNRLKNITDGQPYKIFLMLGINDLILGKNVDEIIKNYEEIVQFINENSKESEIYIESVLPVSKYKENVICCDNVNAVIVDLNQRLNNLAYKYSINYINLYRHFEESGGLNMNLTVDGIHLNGEGYLLLASEIKNYLE